MTKLLEIKDKLVRFYSKYDTYLFPVVKFIAAFLLFFIISSNIGFMGAVSSLPVVIVLALVCCLMPVNIILLLAGIVILLDMYALAMEAAVVTLVLFLLVYFAYFRFVPSDGMLALLTPICFRLNIPYIMPVTSGLLCNPYSVLSVLCSTMVYFYLDGIKQNEGVLAAVTAEEEISSKFNIAIGQITSNKEMLLVMAVFLLVSLVVYMVRRSSMEHSWTIAIIFGILIQVIGIFVGDIVLNITQRTVALLLGGIVSLLIGFVIEFFRMNLDYARTERVQFEDDEYYYYVRAVPKKMVASSEKVVKHFGNTAKMGKRIDSGRANTSIPDEEMNTRVIARELDIDEDMLK